MQKERTTERKEAAASAKEKKIPVPARMTVEHGLRQLAFGDISDAVRLIFGPPGEPEELEKMGLSIKIFAIPSQKGSTICCMRP